MIKRILSCEDVYKEDGIYFESFDTGSIEIKEEIATTKRESL